MNAGILPQAVVTQVQMPGQLLGRASPVSMPYGGGCDPYWPLVTLLVHFDGGVNGTAFVDSSPLRNALAVNGAASLSNAKKITNQTSGLFASSSWLDVAYNASQPVAFGTRDFTVELWFLTTNLSTQNTLIDTRPALGNGAYLFLAVKTTGALFVYVNSADRIVSASGAVKVNTWNHAAVCRVAGVTRLFLNGDPVGSWADATNYGQQASVARPRIGSSGYFSGGGENLIGNMDELRITKAGRYVTPFTPSTATLPEK